MIQTVTLWLTIVLGLSVLGLSLYVLVMLYREKGIGHALLGFFISPYAYIWGWINAKRLRMIDVMVAWTLLTLLSIAFPMIISIQEAAKAMAAFDTTFVPSGNDGDGTYTFTYTPDTISMGSIQVGVQVSGEITNILDTHAWTFNGTTGQTVTIQSKATSGRSFAPRMTLLGPDGTTLTSTYGGQEDTGSLISSFTLPADGQYTLEINLWEIGPYEIDLN